MRTEIKQSSFVPRASAVEVHTLNAFPCTPLGTYFQPAFFFLYRVVQRTAAAFVNYIAMSVPMGTRKNISGRNGHGETSVIIGILTHNTGVK